MRETTDMDGELDDHVVKASFIRKVEQERAKTAGPAVPAAVTDADRHMFAEAVVRMHEDWWAREAAPLRSQGARRGAPDMPVRACARPLPTLWTDASFVLRPDHLSTPQKRRCHVS